MSAPQQNGKTKLTNKGTNRYQMIGLAVGNTRADGWLAIDNTTICMLVKYITCAGDAVLFSTSQQGGLSITIYSEGEPTKIVSNDVADMTRKLVEATAIARNSIPAEVLERMEAAV